MSYRKERNARRNSKSASVPRARQRPRGAYPMSHYQKPMFIRRNQKPNKRGFTLAESVLALAVISISSVGILSLVLSSQRATINAAQKQQAQLYAMDIINCYRADGDFATNVNFALGAAYNESTGEIPLNNMTAQVAFDEEESTVTVTIVKDGKTLAEADFTKGVL